MREQVADNFIDNAALAVAGSIKFAVAGNDAMIWMFDGGLKNGVDVLYFRCYPAIEFDKFICCDGFYDALVLVVPVDELWEMGA